MDDEAFQQDAFQNNAFQTGGVAETAATDAPCSGSVTATDEANPG